VYKATETGYRNLETKDLMDKSQKSKGQTKDSKSKRHLSGLHNNSSSSEMELV